MGINSDELLRRCIHRELLARQLVRVFLASATRLLDELRQSALRGEYHLLGDILHSLQGGAAVVAADEVRYLAASLAHVLQTSGTLVMADIDRLESAVHRVRSWAHQMYLHDPSEKL